MAGIRTVLSALTHANPLLRAAVAWPIGCALLLATWSATYHLLPERAVSAGWLAGKLPLPLEPSAGPYQLALVIFAWNLALGGGTLLAASFFRIGRLPLVYLATWLWFVAYGVLLGTNSFAFPSPTGKFGPALDGLWAQVGLREMTAYAVVASALADFSLWQYRSWRDTPLPRVRRWSEVRLTPAEGLVVVAGVALLGWSASSEAGQLVRLFTEGALGAAPLLGLPL